MRRQSSPPLTPALCPDPSGNVPASDPAPAVPTIKPAAALESTASPEVAAEVTTAAEVAAAAEVVPHAGTRSGGIAPVTSAPAAALGAATATSVYAIADSLIERATEAEWILDCDTWVGLRKQLQQLYELLSRSCTSSCTSCFQAMYISLRTQARSLYRPQTPAASLALPLSWPHRAMSLREVDPIFNVTQVGVRAVTAFLRKNPRTKADFAEAQNGLQRAFAPDGGEDAAPRTSAAQM